MKRYKLMLGDCLKRMKEIEDESIDLICTDPAYKVISGGVASPLVSGYSKSVLGKNDGKIFKHNNIKIVDYMTEFYRILRKGSHCYVMINNLNLRELLNVAHDVGFSFSNLLRWDKNNKNASRWYMKDCEYTVFLYKKPAKPINNMSSSQGFFCKNPTNKIHPTEKPVKLMRHYIKNSTKPGDIVLDPFLGSGSTGVAALKAKRRFIGIEMDKAYYKVAKNRIKESLRK